HDLPRHVARDVHAELSHPELVAPQKLERTDFSRRPVEGVRTCGGQNLRHRVRIALVHDELETDADGAREEDRETRTSVDKAARELVESHDDWRAEDGDADRTDAERVREPEI